jgi:hypothetical protein
VRDGRSDAVTDDRGSTSSEAGGTVFQREAPQPPSGGDKEQRGNTPPGLDRDGHGPAAGAIVDPTGAATRGSPVR